MRKFSWARPGCSIHSFRPCYTGQNSVTWAQLVIKRAEKHCLTGRKGDQSTQNLYAFAFAISHLGIAGCSGNYPNLELDRPVFENWLVIALLKIVML